MGMQFRVSQEYFEDFDPEKFAEMIKAKAAAEAEAGEDGVDKQ